MGRSAVMGGLTIVLALALMSAPAGAATQRTCKGVGGAGGGATSSIRATNTSCKQARKVARAWLRAGCRTDGTPCSVERFTCRSHQPRSSGAVLTPCRRQRKRLHFSSD